MSDQDIYETEEQLDEVSKKAAISAYADMHNQDHPKSDEMLAHIKRKFGPETAAHAQKHAETQYYGRGGLSAALQKRDPLADAKPSSKMRTTKAGIIHKQDIAAKKSEIRSRMKEEYEDSVTEDSIAMDTLHANSRPAGDDPKSKVEAINHVIGAMHAMKSDELTKWFHDAMALIGKEDSHLPGSANEKGNEDTLNMKPSHAVGKGGAAPNEPMPKLDHKNNPLASMREDVEEMFVGQDLSEEFKDRAITLFEAAVNARAITEIASLEEQYETRLQEETASIIESVEANLDTYLNYIVEKWMEDNQVAIESALRNEIMEEFITGLKGLFAEHYIDMPEDKIDVVESLADKVEELENALDSAINENVELKSIISESERFSAIDELSEGLTMTQAEKFAALAEGVSFDGDLDTYKSKLQIVKETYFTSKATASSTVEDETFEITENSDKTVAVDPEVNRYVQAISRSIKR